ncbi:MAG: hypothetical protein J6Y60_04210 [Treponema sp.]|nr:hypothetical protein [Treponema sp.]
MKKFLLSALILAALMPAFAKSYSVGDIGPGGGIVFYKSVEGFEVDDGMGSVQICHYLEVSPEDLGSTTWIPSTASFLGDLDDIYSIGAGKANTFLIANAGLCPEELTKENCAAFACSVYSTKTTSAGDWYLPSSDELKLVFKNLTLEQLKCTSKDFYWSSSEEGEGSAWARKNKTSTIDSKNQKFLVRAIHAF